MSIDILNKMRIRSSRKDSNCYEFKMMDANSEDGYALEQGAIALNNAGFDAFVYQVQGELFGYVFCKSEHYDYLVSCAQKSLINISEEPMDKFFKKFLLNNGL